MKSVTELLKDLPCVWLIWPQWLVRKLTKGFTAINNNVCCCVHLKEIEIFPILYKNVNNNGEEYNSMEKFILHQNVTVKKEYLI